MHTGFDRISFALQYALGLCSAIFCCEDTGVGHLNGRNERFDRPLGLHLCSSAKFYGMFAGYLTVFDRTCCTLCVFMM